MLPIGKKEFMKYIEKFGNVLHEIFYNKILKIIFDENLGKKFIDLLERPIKLNSLDCEKKYIE